jgi:hypothetical protein
MAELAQAQELSSTIRSLGTKVDRYRSNYLQPLGPQQIVRAWRDLIEIQNTVADLEKKWLDYSDAQFTRVFEMLAADKTSLGLQIRHWLGVSQRIGSNEIVGLSKVTREGYRMIGQLSSLPSCTSHFHEQCSTFIGTTELNAPTAKLEASQIDALIRLKIDALRNDVDSKQRQISLLNLYSQTELSNQMKRLNGLLVIFTVGLLVATVLLITSVG